MCVWHPWSINWNRSNRRSEQRFRMQRFLFHNVKPKHGHCNRFAADVVDSTASRNLDHTRLSQFSKLWHINQSQFKSHQTQSMDLVFILICLSRALALSLLDCVTLQKCDSIKWCAQEFWRTEHSSDERA